MMRESSTRRDQREIVIPGDMRKQRTGTVASGRRPSAPHRSIGGGAELWAALRAGAVRTGRMCVARPGEAVGALVVLGAVAYVSVNALGLQAGRHPAPILPVAQSEPAKIAAAQRAKEPAASEMSTPGPIAKANEPSPKPRIEARAPVAPPRDGIAEVLRAAGETTASVNQKSDKSILTAQRALAKLGYAGIKPDGVMGPGTKAAVEKFERAHKLPVTGEPTGRTLRELSAKAGLPKG